MRCLSVFQLFLISILIYEWLRITRTNMKITRRCHRRKDSFNEFPIDFFFLSFCIQISWHFELVRRREGKTRIAGNCEPWANLYRQNRMRNRRRIRHQSDYRKFNWRNRFQGFGLNRSTAQLSKTIRKWRPKFHSRQSIRFRPIYALNAVWCVRGHQAKTNLDVKLNKSNNGNLTERWTHIVHGTSTSYTHMTKDPITNC